MEWAKCRITTQTAKLWSNIGFSPQESKPWITQKFTHEEARSWSYTGITPILAGQWGPFEKWTPEEATEWMVGGFTASEMKYWISKETPFKEAQEWNQMGISSSIHMTLGKNFISRETWEKWQTTAPIAEAAKWIKHGFGIEQAQIWREYRVQPEQAAQLKGKITPMEAKEWLHLGFEAEDIEPWRSHMPNAKMASEYCKVNIEPLNAGKWAEMGMEPEEAQYFEKGGWAHDRTEAWIHTQEINLEMFKPYIHYSSTPDKILEWVRSRFHPTMARQWMEIEIGIPLATTMDNAKISPNMVAEYTEAGYTLDEAIPLLFKGIPLDKAPSPKRKRGENMTYSEKIKKRIPQV
ncbi:hypothetical protein DSO57_1031087 [Entomophthora muscae]|uniref:Uncharacterized protein n=1 Tax=Entomophthora muscae TaxID=34485 RepID=A0ACC2UKS0_9FUNG|nr:hypothetical protein DSO57_1031087 [Entomophthora muscae]